MLLTIATTHRPATDLGYLLMKHPDNVHAVELPFGRATVLYPQADDTRPRRSVISQNCLQPSPTIERYPMPPR